MGTLLNWSSRSWQSTQMGPGPLLLPHVGLSQRKKRTSGLQSNTGQEKKNAGHVWIRKSPSGELMGIKRFGRCSGKPTPLLLASFIIAVVKRPTKKEFKRGGGLLGIIVPSMVRRYGSRGSSWACHVASEGCLTPEDKQEMGLGYKSLRPPLVTHFLLMVLQPSQTAPSAGEKALKHTSLWCQSAFKAHLVFSGLHTLRADIKGQPTHTQDLEELNL